MKNRARLVQKIQFLLAVFRDFVFADDTGKTSAMHWQFTHIFSVPLHLGMGNACKISMHISVNNTGNASDVI